MALPPLLAILPEPSQVDAAFSAVAAAWGVRHSGMDAAAIFFLVLLRWVTIAQLCPFLGGKLVPATVKIGLSMVLAWFVTPSLSASLPVPLHIGQLRFFFAALHEIGIGLLLGFGSSLVFLAATMG